MTYDEEMIASVRALDAVQSICTNKRLYHAEVLQSTDFDNYPCITYSMVSNEPLEELDDTAGLRQAEFEFTSYSRLTGDVRALQEAIDSLNNTIGTELEWIQVRNTTDSFEPPIDLDEKGMKAAQQTVTVWYRPSATTTTTPAP